MYFSILFLHGYKKASLFYAILSLIISCHTGPQNKAGESTAGATHKKHFVLSTPSLDQIFSFNDSVFFAIKSTGKIQADSVNVFVEGLLVQTETDAPLSFSASNVFTKVGRQNLRIVVYCNEGRTHTIITRITVLSDIEPRILSYRLIRTIPHNTDDFTQGLVYYDSKIYESTGRQGFSKLMRKNPETGVTELERKMDDSFFGEGIAIVNNRIYQLTYRQKVGFVYDISTFDIIREFNLQTQEGWGLATDGKNLIVSDGSSVLYYYDSEYLNHIRQIEVSNNRGLVNNLNELEYVDGAIWANVYGQSFIIKIDAETGKILARLELESLFPKTIPRDYDHVLNGIAYNPESNTYFVTGKLWPVMYEIEIK